MTSDYLSKSYNLIVRKAFLKFLGGSDGKESACNAGDLGSTPRLGRCPGGGHGNPPVFLPEESPWPEEPGGLQSMGWQRLNN